MIYQFCQSQNKNILWLSDDKAQALKHFIILDYLFSIRLIKCYTYLQHYLRSETTTPKCEKVIWWWEYCPTYNNYVPPYCYASSTTWEYLANMIWNYSSSYVIRNLYMDNYWYTISKDKIQANDIKNWYSKIKEAKMEYPRSNYKSYPMPID